jgi:peptide methionine sulfoxide reductase msrA/msrB
MIKLIAFNIAVLSAGVCIMTAEAEQNTETIVLGMGCFWGAEKRMRAIQGVIDVECGYAGGDLADVRSYEGVLMLEKLVQTGLSQARNHAEVVKVIFDPGQVSLETILIHFWENHDPTQGNRQGFDIGSNYRSAIYTLSQEQMAIAEKSKAIYEDALSKAGYPSITTEIMPLQHYTSAESYHQRYLQKNPHGYCGLGGTGVAYPREPEVDKQ